MGGRVGVLLIVDGGPARRNVLQSRHRARANSAAAPSGIRPNSLLLALRYPNGAIRLAYEKTRTRQAIRFSSHARMCMGLSACEQI